jgi:hypothetical protein
MSCEMGGPSGRVRKFGRSRFAGESCRSSGGVTRGSGGRRTLATTAPPSPRSSRAGRRDRGTGICSAESVNSDGEAEPSPITGQPEGSRNDWRTLTRPAAITLRFPLLCPSCGRNAGDRGFRIYLESDTTEFTAPTGSTPARRPRARVRREAAPGERASACCLTARFSPTSHLLRDPRSFSVGTDKLGTRASQ